MTRRVTLGGLVLAVLALPLGVLAGVAAVAVHHSLPLLLLAAAGALAAVRALRWWTPRAAVAFTVGWLVALVVALAGRPEGDYVVAGGLPGTLLIALGLVVLVTGLASGLAPGPRHDSSSGAGHT